MTVAVVAIAIASVACAHAESESSTTTPTSAPYDIDVGPCMCRTPQDELSSCCRGSVELTCRCEGRTSCQLVSTGRQCHGSAAQ